MRCLLADFLQVETRTHIKFGKNCAIHQSIKSKNSELTVYYSTFMTPDKCHDWRLKYIWFIWRITLFTLFSKESNNYQLKMYKLRYHTKNRSLDTYYLLIHKVGIYKCFAVFSFHYFSYSKTFKVIKYICFFEDIVAFKDFLSDTTEIKSVE